MSVIYFITGPKNFYARLFFSFLGSATCVLVYLFAKDMFGQRIALITGVIASIYPGLFIYDGWLYSESLYTFLMVAFTYSLYRLQRIAQWQWAPSDNIYLVILLRWLQRASWRRWMILSGVLLGLLVGGAIWWLTCNEPGTRRSLLWGKARREGLQATSPAEDTSITAEDIASPAAS